MEKENQEDIAEVSPSDTAQTDQVTEPVEQDPLKVELEKVKTKGRTQAEKLLFTKKRIDEQLKELGIVEEPEQDDDDKPVTLGMLKRMQSQTAAKSALDLAEDIQSETERELTKYHLENTIKSTGNPNEDLKLARTIVNAAKNGQITEEANRRPEVRTHSSGAGAPPKMEIPIEYTAEELKFMGAPFNLSKEQILAARPK